MTEKLSKTKVYWTENENDPVKYEWLSRDAECETAIIGGGLAGAFCAEKFAREGVDTLLVTQSPVGYGMTETTPGVATYCIDGGLNMLAQRVGREEAFAVYHMLYESLSNIEKLAEELGDFGLRRCDELIYGDTQKMAEGLKKEYATLHFNNYNLEFYDSENSYNDFSFDIKGGIYSSDLTLTLNPYKLCCELVKKAVSDGARVYENTEVTECTEEQDGTFTLHTKSGHKVKAKKVIYAAGKQTAESMDFLMAKTVFNLVTEPIEELKGWKNAAVITKVSDDMYRMRVTEDGRILISGLPAKLFNSEGKFCGLMSIKRFDEKKFGDLLEILQENFPGIRDIKPEFLYTGVFYETADLLPVIGNTKDEPNIFYDYCGGSNGIAFAEVASRLIYEQYSGRHNRDIDVFKKDRKTKLIPY